MLCTYCKLNQMTVSDRAKVLVIIKNNSKVDWIDAPSYWCSRAAMIKRWTNKKLSLKQMYKAAHRCKHTHTHSELNTQTHIFQQKVSSTVQPLFCLVPFIEAVWWRGPKFDHAFSLDWSPPYLESLFVAMSLHSCLCHAPRRESERNRGGGGGLINLQEYASLSFKTAAEQPLTARSAQQSTNILIHWNRHSTEGRHNSKNTQSDLCGLFYIPPRHSLGLNINSSEFYLSDHALENNSKHKWWLKSSKDFF